MSDLTGELIKAGKRRRDARSENREGEEEEQGIAHRVRKRSRFSSVSDGISDWIDDSVPKPNAVASDTPRKGRSGNSRNFKQSEVSTLWPLFPEHCPTPEFDFEEEITTIAEVWFRDSNRSDQSQDGNANTISGDEEDASETDGTPKPTRTFNYKTKTLSNLNVHPLLLSANTFLNSLLEDLARHRLRMCNVEKGKAAPMQWVDVLEAVGSMSNPGLDFETLSQIQNRLCKIYGHEECIALKSVQAISKSKQALREMDKKFQSMLFDNLSIPIGVRKRMKVDERKFIRADKKDENGKSDENHSGDDDQENESDESANTICNDKDD